MNKEKIKGFIKSKTGVAVITGVIAFSIGGCSAGTSEYEAKITDLQNKSIEMEETITTFKTDNEKLTSDLATANKKIEEAKPFFEMKEEEQKQLAEKVQVEREAKAKAEAEEKARAEAEAQKKREEEEKAKIEAEKNKYNTGLTYEDLARNPVDNMLKYVSFNGKIIQVMNGDGYKQYRMAVNSDYDKVVLVEIKNELLTNGNILEDDIVTVRGQYIMEQTYTTVMGAERTIPAIVVEQLDY